MSNKQNHRANGRWSTKGFALTTLLAMLATETAFGHDADPHPLVQEIAGKWERDSILSDRLGAVEGIGTLVFQKEHSVESRERQFRDDDNRSTQLLHAPLLVPAARV